METKTERHLTGRQWWGLTVLALPTLLLSLDFSVLYLALPSLATDLAPTGSQELWIMDIYGTHEGARRFSGLKWFTYKPLRT